MCTQSEIAERMKNEKVEIEILKTLKAQRDDLLDACKEMIGAHDTGEAEGSPRTVENLRVAVAKAENETVCVRPEAKLEDNQKLCENHCPKCGAVGNDIDWDCTNTEFGDPSYSQQTATCRKCWTDFCEVFEHVYQYTEITGDA